MLGRMPDSDGGASRDPRVSTADVVLATVLWLLSTAGPVIWLRTRWSLDGDIAEDPAYIVFFVAVGALCAALLFVDRDRTRAALADPHRRSALVGLAALAAVLTLSAAWSLDRGLTATHGLRLIGTVAMGLFIAVRLDLISQAVTAWIAVQIGCAWSFVQIYRVAPGTQDDQGDWVGIFVNRNSLGLVSAVGATLGVLLAVHVWSRWSGRERLLAVAVLALAVLLDLRLLLGSGSATPLLALLLLAGTSSLVVLARRLLPSRLLHDARIVTAAAVSLAATVVVSALVLPVFSGVVGKGGDLSRREPLWDFVQHKIGDRPLWGYGYLGGWEDRAFNRERRTYVRGGDLITAHNSALEVALGAGLLALALFAVVLVVAGRRTIASALRGRPLAVALWPLVALLWFAIESLTETFLVANTLPTLLLVVAALASAAPGDELVPADDGPGVEASAVAHQTD